MADSHCLLNLEINTIFVSVRDGVEMFSFKKWQRI